MISQMVASICGFFSKITIHVRTSLEHLEMELEALLWLCFSLGYILFIFEENIFFLLFFAEIFFIEKKSRLKI